MAFSFFFKRLPLPEPPNHEKTDGLRPSFGIYSLIFQGISGSMLCYVTYSVYQVAHVTGPSACLTYVVTGLLSIFFGLCYIDLSTHYPTCGSVYAYTNMAIGQIPAFIIGWNNQFDIMMFSAMMVKSVSHNLDIMLNRTISQHVIYHIGRLGPPNSNYTLDDAPPFFDETFDIIAFLLLLLLGAVLFLKVTISVAALNVITGTSVVAIIVIFGASFVLGHAENFVHPHGFFPYGYSGFSHSVSLALFCFMSYDQMAVCSEEARNPRRDIPTANFCILLTNITLSASSAAALTFLRPYTEVASFAAVFRALHRPGLFWFTMAVIVTSMSVGAYVNLYVASRYVFSITRDQLLPSIVAWVHPRLGTPMVASAFVATVSAFSALFMHSSLLEKITPIGPLCSTLAIGVDLIVIRYLPTEGEAEEEAMELRFLPERYLAQRAIGNILKKPLFFKFVLFFLIVSIMISVGLSSVVILNHPHIGLIVLTAAFGLVSICCILLLCLYLPRPRRTKGFSTKGLPIVPVVAIIISASMISRLYLVAVIRFFAVTIIGLLICLSTKLYYYKKAGYQKLK